MFSTLNVGTRDPKLLCTLNLTLKVEKVNGINAPNDSKSLIDLINRCKVDGLVTVTFVIPTGYSQGDVVISVTNASAPMLDSGPI